MKDAENITAAFDWVSKRAACSLMTVFLAIKVGAEQDVNTRNSINASEDFGERRTFGFKDHGRKFYIFTEVVQPPKILEFALLSHCITVCSDGTILLKAGITLNNDCDCKLVVDDEELDEWQFRKMALETLFFGER